MLFNQTKLAQQDINFSFVWISRAEYVLEKIQEA